jgi:hypothetical protein
MAEVRYNKDHPSGATPGARIAYRLRNSGVGGRTQPDSTTLTGNSARRTYTNIHNTGGHQSPPVMPVSEGEKR